MQMSVTVPKYRICEYVDIHRYKYMKAEIQSNSYRLERVVI